MNLNGVCGDARKRIEAADMLLNRPWDGAAVTATYQPKTEDRRWIPLEQFAGYHRLSRLELLRFRLGVVAYAITAWIDPVSYAEGAE